MRTTSNISMTEAQRTFVEELVSSGAYANVSEVVRAGVRLLQEREAHLAILRAEVAKGLAAMDMGQVSHAGPEDIIAKADALNAVR